MQFIRGVPEPSVPEVQLTRAKDGSSGTATFVFGDPSVFEASEDLGEITGLYMVDPEGMLETVDVQVPPPPGRPGARSALLWLRAPFNAAWVGGWQPWVRCVIPLAPFLYAINIQHTCALNAARLWCTGQ